MKFSLFGLSEELTILINVVCAVIALVYIISRVYRKYKLSNNKHIHDVRNSSKHFAESFNDDDLK